MSESKYFKKLTSGTLDDSGITKILNRIKTFLEFNPVPDSLFSKANDQEKISEKLSRFPINLLTGNKSWSGLAICFPGKMRSHQVPSWSNRKT
jgi:hypothetical protein